jgi:uncharacterized delta-60 repeat protein
MIKKTRIILLIVGAVFFVFTSCPLENGDGGAPYSATGELDDTFDPGTGTNSSVACIAIRNDGKIIIGGGFNSYNGTAIYRIARLNTDGSLDSGFDPGTGVNNQLLCTAIQSDGKIIIGGSFTSCNGTGRNNIARVNADGSLDNTFDPGTGTDDSVRCQAIQSDGKIIIGGGFSIYNGVGRNRIARLNTDGSLDNAFDIGTGVIGTVLWIAIQSDGKIIIVGNFTSYNGTGRNCIARINVDGSLDNTFDPGTGADNYVEFTDIQSDGKIIIVGGFTSYNGTGRNCIARINTDGSLDNTFDPGTGANNAVVSTALQSDGKIIIGGWFTSYNGTGRNHIARLNIDGSLDAAFDPGTGANSPFGCIALQSNGKIIIGGGFTSYNGTARNHIARIK